MHTQKHTHMYNHIPTTLNTCATHTGPGYSGKTTSCTDPGPLCTSSSCSRLTLWRTLPQSGGWVHGTATDTVPNGKCGIEAQSYEKCDVSKTTDWALFFGHYFSLAFEVIYVHVTYLWWSCDHHVTVMWSVFLPLHRPLPPRPVQWWPLVVQLLPSPQTQVLLAASQTLGSAEQKSNKVKSHVNGFYCVSESAVIISFWLFIVSLVKLYLLSLMLKSPHLPPLPSLYIPLPPHTHPSHPYPSQVFVRLFYARTRRASVGSASTTWTRESLSALLERAPRLQWLASALEIRS